MSSRIPEKVIKRIYDRYGDRCALCLEPLEGEHRSIHHIYPVDWSGTIGRARDDEENLVPLCGAGQEEGSCHQRVHLDHASPDELRDAIALNELTLAFAEYEGRDP